MPVPQRLFFLWVGILPAFQEQARCLFHKDCISCGVGILPAFLEQARCLFHKDCISCGVGILPA
ncbi:hypothetical protein Q5690_07740, partial [Microcoleus sp. F10-D1]